MAKLITLAALERFRAGLQGGSTASQSTFVGERIVSAKPINPAEMYGGTWEEKNYHNFHSDYVYERIA